MRPTIVILVMFLVATAGCSKQSGGSLNAGVAVSNPSNFPLYQPSTVVSVAPFDFAAIAQTIYKNSSEKETVPPYRGNEILATTSASVADLDAWLKKLEVAPPSGFHVRARTASNSAIVKNYGADDVIFETPAQGRAVLVLVMDPKQVKQKLGIVLDLIDKYQALPAPLRGTIDDKVKKQAGFTVSQVLDKSSPLGLMIVAVRDLGDSDKRAIVLVDESKE